MYKYFTIGKKKDCTPFELGLLQYNNTKFSISTKLQVDVPSIANRVIFAIGEEKAIFFQDMYEKGYVAKLILSRNEETIKGSIESLLNS